MATRVLAANQSVARRPFTAVSLYPRDGATLGYMLEDLRVLLARMATGDMAVTPYQSNEWLVHGLKRRVIVANAMGLYNRRTVCVVGFFGERHPEQDHAPLEEANAEIVLEFRNFPGILSYSSMELPDGNWANLVLHDIPEVREYWRTSERHARAAKELSPKYYQTVRIHNGTLAGGIMSRRTIAIERTKYWDYRTSKVWHAVRELTTPSAGLAH